MQSGCIRHISDNLTHKVDVVGCWLPTTKLISFFWLVRVQLEFHLYLLKRFLCYGERINWSVGERQTNTEVYGRKADKRENNRQRRLKSYISLQNLSAVTCSLKVEEGRSWRELSRNTLNNVSYSQLALYRFVT